MVKTDPKASSDQIERFISSYVEEYNVLSDVSAEVAFQLPMSQINKFEALFDALDAQKRQLDIQTYGVSITTMEEVFLRVAHLGDDAMAPRNSLKIEL